MIGARNSEALNEVKQSCEKLGASAIALQLDVTVESDCKSFAERAISEFKSIDILINNAGVSMRSMFSDLDISTMQKIMETNFWGTVYCTRYALDELVKNRGSLISVGSVAGYKALPARSAYSASKFALNGFMDSIRLEYLKKNLHVGIIFPGYTRSNIRQNALNSAGVAQGESPLDENKLMPAEEVAEQIVDMVISRRREKILDFEGKMVRLLNFLFPGLLDRLVYKKVSSEKDSPFH